MVSSLDRIGKNPKRIHLSFKGIPDILMFGKRNETLINFAGKRHQIDLPYPEHHFVVLDLPENPATDL